MKEHKYVQRVLSEYILRTLDPHEKKSVEAHLAVCEDCATELKMVRSIMDRIVHSTNKPSEERPPEFWRSFAMNVEERIRRSEQEEVRFYPSLWDRLREIIALKGRHVVAFSSAISVVIAAFILWKSFPQSEQKLPDRPVVQQAVGVEPPSANIHQYFRKSKTLLVGLTNMKTEAGWPIDLEAERKVSRELIHEARSLKVQPMDIRSARLIGDLEKILIGLANLKDQNELSNMEMIRNGIQQENLLFKVRMAEALHDTTGYINVKNTYKEE